MRTLNHSTRIVFRCFGLLTALLPCAPLARAETPGRPLADMVITSSAGGSSAWRLEPVVQQVPRYPRQLLSYPYLQVLDAAGPNMPYIDVEEWAPQSLMFGLGVNSDAGLTNTSVHYDSSAFLPLKLGSEPTGADTASIGEDPNNPYSDILANLKETSTFSEPFDVRQNASGVREDDYSANQPNRVFRLNLGAKPVRRYTGFATSDESAPVFFGVGYFH